MRPKSLFFLGIGIILRTSERAAPSADAAPHQGRGPPQSHQAGPLLQRVARPVFVVARAVALDRLDVQRFLCAGQQDTRICGGIRSSQKNHLRLCSHDILKTSFTDLAYQGQSACQAYTTRTIRPLVVPIRSRFSSRCRINRCPASAAGRVYSAPRMGSEEPVFLNPLLAELELPRKKRSSISVALDRLAQHAFYYRLS